MRMADGLDCAQEVEPMCVVVRGTVASYSTLFLYCGFVILSFGGSFLLRAHRKLTISYGDLCKSLIRKFGQYVRDNAVHVALMVMMWSGVMDELNLVKR